MTHDEPYWNWTSLALWMACAIFAIAVATAALFVSVIFLLGAGVAICALVVGCHFRLRRKSGRVWVTGS